MCFEGVRTPTITWVCGREVIEVRKAVPSSPAPRRRTWVCLVVDVIAKGVKCWRLGVGCCLVYR